MAGRSAKELRALERETVIRAIDGESSADEARVQRLREKLGRRIAGARRRNVRRIG